MKAKVAKAKVAKAKIVNREYQHGIYQELLESGTEPLLARLFASRNISTPDEIETGFKHLLHYSLMKNMDKAAERLAQAVIKREKIMIIADYDADGATACAVGMRGLDMFGATVDFLVPNRFEDGYGMSVSLVETAHKLGTTLLVTVDNGISAISGVKRARELGIDVIVTDHHLAGDELPDCIIVNPNQPDCPFPSKSLAGVGVIFYVLLALRANLKEKHYFNQFLIEPDLKLLLDLVALGTVADVVRLDHNNRILVSQGLQRIRNGRICQGIHALFSITKRDYRKSGVFDLGFAIAPRINAAGRLDDMSLGIRCLVENDEMRAMDLAQQLDQLNSERQQIEKSMIGGALLQSEIEVNEDKMTIVAYDQSWHQGVIGIVAGRLREKYNRPVIVFAPSDNNELRGSGRSIDSLHLRDALDLVHRYYPDMMVKFGGHAMAAGLTLKADKLSKFQQSFEEVTKKLITTEDLTRTFVTDGSLDEEDINLIQAQSIATRVWGQGFAQPSFNDRFKVIWQKIVGQNHKKLGLQKGEYFFEAMIFGCSDDIPSEIIAVYKLIPNEFRNQLVLQLYIDYWEKA